MDCGMRGNDLLLETRQQQLPFGQGQPSLACSVAQIGDITEIIGPVDLHDVGRLFFYGQPQFSPTSQSKPRVHPQSENRRKKYRFGARTPNLQAVPPLGERGANPQSGTVPLRVINHPVALTGEIAIQRAQRGPQLSRRRDGLSPTLLALKMMHQRVDPIDVDSGIRRFAIPQPPVQPFDLCDDHRFRRPFRIIDRQAVGVLLSGAGVAWRYEADRGSTEIVCCRGWFLTRLPRRHRTWTKTFVYLPSPNGAAPGFDAWIYRGAIGKPALLQV
jgi:hypothetical protein